MNGNWSPWSEQVNGNSPGQYILAWRHVHDIFTANGVTNVTWVWTPNITGGNGVSPEGYYPGDQYVDWAGLDGYNSGPDQNGNVWESFSQVFSASYNKLLQIAPNKPFMIAETSSTEVGGSKAAWITDVLVKQIPVNFPNIKALVWFNVNKESDWRVESSLAAQNAFAKGIGLSVYASNQFANLNTSPIPPLK
jgi:beta-mannanase